MSLQQQESRIQVDNLAKRENIVNYQRESQLELDAAATSVKMYDVSTKDV